jgi:hypothetical protein
LVYRVIGSTVPAASRTLRNIRFTVITCDGAASDWRAFWSSNRPLIRRDVCYRIDREHEPAEDLAVHHEDAELGIHWPVDIGCVSERGRNAGSWSELCLSGRSSSIDRGSSMESSGLRRTVSGTGSARWRDGLEPGADIVIALPQAEAEGPRERRAGWRSVGLPVGRCRPLCLSALTGAPVTRGGLLPLNPERNGVR